MGAYLIVIAITLLSLCIIIGLYFKVKKMDEGPENVAEMAGIIRDGAKVFTKTEYKAIIPVVVVVALIFSLLIEKTSGITFMIGAISSSIVCAIIGMNSATRANCRTTAVAERTRSIGETVKVALMGGAIGGLSVPTFGLLGAAIILILWDGIDPFAVGSGLLLNVTCNPFIMRLTTFSLGCSLIAMFNRVAGGNYTKAADISADILAKIRSNLPEDDARVPNIIADFIGDMINDIAGNFADLNESFVATIVASIMIAVYNYNGAITNGVDVTAETFNATLYFPILLATVGLVSCILGIGIALLKKMGNNPAKELDLVTYISAGFTSIGAILLSKYFFDGIKLYDAFKLGWVSPALSAILGIISGVAIGIITEYYTSADKKPTRKLAEIAPEGHAFVITKGDALGKRSCFIPVCFIAISLVISGFICGNYGIAISSLGMLSFVGTTVSIDAFGPIADNAGGLAESCHLDADVRVITDKLDSVGNTTAAIGKGFAIGSAAFATVSLITAFASNNAKVGEEPILNIASFIVIAGALIGAALIELFSAILTDNTIDSAKLMADEGDRQLNIPGVLEGTVKPDYNKCIEMATNEALSKMLMPSLIALIAPVIGGFLFGIEFVGGLLVGATLTAIVEALFMGNSGGAFDNAKKYIESGALAGHGKGSEAHKAAVTGDTVGDTRKDVVGVDLDIFIKMISTVANTLAPLFIAASLF